jgi:hypothetical protein
MGAPQGSGGAAPQVSEGFPGSDATTGHVSCVDGVAYVDRRIFAVVDRERSDWYLLRQGEHQAVLVLRPVPEQAF